MHALAAEGVKPVIIRKNIKNIVLRSFILRFEAFNLHRIVVMPINTNPYMSARYCQNMINATIFKIIYSFFF